RVFTAVAALSLALGIGANTMIFGVTYSVLFEPLPLPHPEQLVALQRVTSDETDRSFTYAEIEALRQSPGIMRITAARDMDNSPVLVSGQRTVVSIDVVNGNDLRRLG